MNRDKIETLIVETTVALFEYSDFACEKKCSLSPRLQAALSLLGEIRKDDFNLVKPSKYDFGALIVPEDIKAVLYAQIHEYLQHQKQLSPALVGLSERINQFYEENVEVFEEES